MTSGPLEAAAFATVALSQNLPMGLIEEGARDGRLPLSERHTPEWFAAAAEEHASLLDMAPELQVGEATTPRDLVGMYGDGETHLPQRPEPPESAAPAGDTIRIGLLRELEDLDD